MVSWAVYAKKQVLNKNIKDGNIYQTGENAYRLSIKMKQEDSDPSYLRGRHRPSGCGGDQAVSTFKAHGGRE